MQLVQPLANPYPFTESATARNGTITPVILAVLLSMLAHGLLFSLPQTPLDSTPLHAGSLTVSIESHANPATGIDKGALEIPSKPEASETTPTGSKTISDLQQKTTPEQNGPQHVQQLSNNNRPEKTDTPKHGLEKLPTTTATQNALSASSKQSDITVPASARIRSSLGTHFAHLFRYPQLAQRRGWQGLVKLGVRVNADGHLSNIHLVKTSGHTLLDNDALHTLRRISSLPEARQWLQNVHLDMVLPVEYRLIDG